MLKIGGGGEVDVGKFCLWEKAYLQRLNLSLKSAECIQPHSASAFKNIVKYFVLLVLGVK